MQRRMKRIAIITGASSGMGWEFAYQLKNRVSQIDEFWLIARRAERLDELQNLLQHPCVLISMDVTEASFYSYLQERLDTEPVKVLFLVNCAGFGKLGSVAGQEFEDVTGMVNTNCMALTAVTKLILPYMAKNGRIIQLASSAAFMPQINFSVYAATKSYVLSFSRSLAQELKPQQIFVTAVCPGPVDTEFFSVAEQNQKRPWYKELFMAKASKVVAKALEDSKNKKELSVYGLPMKVFGVLTKYVPHTLILAVQNYLNQK